MADFLSRFAAALWEVFRESSLYLLLGFGVAGLLHALVPETLIQRLLGKGRVRSIVVASLVGVPLPLCSCSVVPTAVALRRRGASRGATVSFLVSTPETGVDSIALTYGLMGWLMAVFRPVAAFVTALVAGLIVELEGGPDPVEPAGGAAPAPESTVGSAEPAAADAAGCEHEHDHAASRPAADHEHDHSHAGHVHGDELDSSEVVGLDERAAPPGSWWRRALRYGYVDLLDDLSHWLLVGLIASALVAAFVPASIVERFLGRGIVPLIAMAVLGVPLYICASASTPIAASLMLKGMSPGAALVFLLTGPASNIGSVVVFTRYLGRRTVAVYLTVVAVLSIAAGALLDVVIASTGIKPVLALAKASEVSASPWQLLATAGFVVLLAGSVARAPVPAEFAGVGRRIEEWLGIPVTRRSLGSLVTAVAVVAWLGTSVLLLRPGEKGVVLEFGRIVERDLEPGFHLHRPAPFGTGAVIAVEQSRTFDVGFRVVPADAGRVTTAEPRRIKDAREGYFLTGDENILDLNLTVEYRARDAVAFGFGVADPEALVRAAIRSTVVEVIGQRGIDGVYTSERADVEHRVRETVQRELDRYGAGIELTRVALLDVHAPTLVHWNFRDVASAREEAFTSVETAKGYVEDTLPKARGEAAKNLAEAGAARVTEVDRAGAEAAAFTSQADAFDASRDVTRLRLYLETVEAVLPGIRKVVREGGASGGLDFWMMPGSGAPAVAAGSSAPRASSGTGTGAAPGDDAQPESPFLKALRRGNPNTAPQGNAP